MKKAKIAAVCLARTTFDYEAANEIYQKTIRKLQAISSVEWVFVQELVITPEQAIAAGEALSRENPDGVAVISGTFHLGHLALALDKHLRKPMLLWAFPELPYNGGKIRLNSACGVNLNASNLYKAGKDDFHCIVSEEMDLHWLDAVRMKAALGAAHVGLAGYRADGFFNLSVSDTDLFRKTGVLLDHYELTELLQPCAGESTALQACFDCTALSASQIEKVQALCGSMEGFIRKNRLDALAVRCWPEFADLYGCSPCAAMSLLAEKGYTIGCEGDVEGTLSLLACNAVSKQPAFLADLSQVNPQEDSALMWHCGVAAPSLWDGISNKTLDTYFAGGRGVTAGFVMQSGAVTMLRMDTARGKTRLFLAQGQAVPMEKELTGTYCKVRFHKPVQEIFNTITQQGIAHHVALVYGDYAATARHFARMMDFALVE